MHANISEIKKTNLTFDEYKKPMKEEISRIGNERLPYQLPSTMVQKSIGPLVGEKASCKR